jgi:hypothetical protein
MIEVVSNANTTEIVTRSLNVGKLRDFARACGLNRNVEADIRFCEPSPRPR